MSRLEQVTAKAEALPYDTYVLIVGDDVDRSDLGELVHERTGQDGLYLVASPRETLDAHIAHDGSEALDGVREVISAHQGPGTGYEGVPDCSSRRSMSQLGAEGAVPDADTDADLGAGADAGADSPGETGVHRHLDPGGARRGRRSAGRAEPGRADPAAPDRRERGGIHRDTTAERGSAEADARATATLLPGSRRICC